MNFDFELHAQGIPEQHSEVFADLLTPLLKKLNEWTGETHNLEKTESDKRTTGFVLHVNESKTLGDVVKDAGYLTASIGYEKSTASTVHHVRFFSLDTVQLFGRYAESLDPDDPVLYDTGVISVTPGDLAFLIRLFHKTFN